MASQIKQTQTPQGCVENVRRCSYGNRLPDARLQQEVAAAFETNAGLEESLECVALAVEAVDDIGARLDERSLKHVRQEREHGVERLEVTARGRLAVLDAGEELGDDREVENEGRREQRVLGG